MHNATVMAVYPSLIPCKVGWLCCSILFIETKWCGTTWWLTDERIVVYKVVELLGANEETANDLALVDALLVVGDAAVGHEIYHSVSKHLRVDAQVLVVRQRSQHRVRDVANTWKNNHSSSLPCFLVFAILRFFAKSTRYTQSSEIYHKLNSKYKFWANVDVITSLIIDFTKVFLVPYLVPHVVLDNLTWTDCHVQLKWFHTKLVF